MLHLYVYSCSLDLVYCCFNLTNRNITKFSERSSLSVYNLGKAPFRISFQVESNKSKCLVAVKEAKV